MIKIFLIFFTIIKFHYILCFSSSDSNFQGIISLNESNFYSELSQNPGKKYLIMFYEPWCPHCKKIFPLIQSLSKLMLTNVTIGMIDCEKNPYFKDLFAIMSYPMIVLIYENYTYEFVEKNITTDNLKNFIMDDYINYEKEEIALTLQKWRYFFKYTKKILKRSIMVLADEPLKGTIFFGSIGLFVLIVFLVSECAAKKLDEYKKHMKEKIGKSK